MFNNYQTEIIKYSMLSKDDYSKAQRIAQKIFDHLYWRGKINQFWAKLTGKSNKLQTLSRQPASTRQKTKIVSVPLYKIVGSESKSDDFDMKFQPLNKHNRSRWINIFIAHRKGVLLPAVDLVQDGDKYYVRDGHHRISVAKMMGQLDIDARVVN